MRISIRHGVFNPDKDLQPIGEELWQGGDDELPAAVLAAMSRSFQPGTWYEIERFREIVAGMQPVEGDEDVRSAVVAEQLGVVNRWPAAIEIGQSQAALMICQSVLKHAQRFTTKPPIWVRVD